MSIFSLTNSLNINSYKDNFINLKCILIDTDTFKSIISRNRLLHTLFNKNKHTITTH